MENNISTCPKCGATEEVKSVRKFDKLYDTRALLLETIQASFPEKIRMDYGVLNGQTALVLYVFKKDDYKIVIVQFKNFLYLKEDRSNADLVCNQTKLCIEKITAAL